METFSNLFSVAYANIREEMCLFSRLLEIELVEVWWRIGKRHFASV